MPTLCADFVAFLLREANQKAAQHTYISIFKTNCLTFCIGKFDILQVAKNFKDWADGEPMGIGAHTFKVLAMGDYVEKHDECSRLWWELSRRQSAANGALMRTSIVGLVQNNFIEQTEDICRLTHYDPRCIGSCVIATSIIHNLVWNDKPLSYEEIKNIGSKYDFRLEEWIDLAYKRKYISELDLDETHSIGYTLRTLAAALWCYWHANSFESGLLAVVNEGGDADTNAAISCAILGAKYGYNAIPEYYIKSLYKEREYRHKVDNFISFATNEKNSN